MILKCCVWPSVTKDNAKPLVNTFNCGNTEIVKRAFRCCPCAFRGRQSVGVEKIIDNASITSDIGRIGTPVIALRLNQSAESM